MTVERLSGTIVFLDVNDAGTKEVADAPSPQRAPVPQPAGLQRPQMPGIRLPLTMPGMSASLLPGGLGIPIDFYPSANAPDLPAASSETTRAVAEQIARATAQGLLEPEASEPMVEEGPADEPEEVEPEPSMDEVADVTPGDGAARHLSIRSSVDEALGPDLQRVVREFGANGKCIDDATFDAATWAPEGFRDVSRLRTNVVGEFDRPDPEGVASLARAYIALTFGAEARHTIETFRAGVPQADILLAMADIVDHGAARRPARLAEQYDCRGAGAMWAALSQPRIPQDAELDTDAVTLAFSALPPHLRKRLGPPLAERLLVYGEAEAASVIRTATLRAPGATTIETQLLDAKIALDAGRKEAGEAKLAEVVEETSGRSVEAVERLLSQRLRSSQPVEDELLAAADALIYEHRGTPEAHRLTELRIEGLAISGEARRALAVLRDSQRHLPDATVARLRGVSFAEAAAQLDDADFLLVAVNAAKELGATPEEMAARRAVAGRLADMELFGLARSLGVEEGLVVGVAPDTRRAPAVAPNFRTAAPETEKTLERAAALLDKSAALREQLATALAPIPETE